MNVFISWSGAESKEVATLLHTYIPKIIQAAKPFLSSESLTNGENFIARIRKELKQAPYGIICITKDNINTPWINYEAGALATLETTRKIVPLLIGINFSDISNHPLHTMQGVCLYDNARDSIKKEKFASIMTGINDALLEVKDNKLDNTRLEEQINFYWDPFSNDITKIKDTYNVPITTEKMMSEPFSTGMAKGALNACIERVDMIKELSSEIDKSLEKLPSLSDNSINENIKNLSKEINDISTSLRHSFALEYNKRMLKPY